ncbi:hypothetical protein ABPG77_002549 [Micractinium sp. CCAP 211/92]
MVSNPHYVRIPHPQSGRLTKQQFYAFYLGEHANRTCRRLHVAGTAGVLTLAATGLATCRPALLLACPLVGYGAAWAGHFFFEHNRPATFKYPLWSLLSDFKLFWEVASGQRPF